MRKLLLMCSIVIVLASCSNSQENKEIDYEQTKQMMIDVLQTDEGKKVLQDIISDEKMKQHLIMQSDLVRETLTETLLSDQAAEMWRNLFDDPRFIESYLKSIGEEQKKLFKNLMHDAEFQSQMIELLQDPEMTKQTLTVMKSQQFREHLEKTIQETMENPLFLAKIEKILLKAAEKESKKVEQPAKKDENSGGQ